MGVGQFAEKSQLLQDMGAQYGQGFMFKKPVPLEDTVQMATERLARARASGRSAA